MEEKTILIVDDEERVRKLLKDFLIKGDLIDEKEFFNELDTLSLKNKSIQLNYSSKLIIYLHL